MQAAHDVRLDAAFELGQQGHVLWTRFLPSKAPRASIVFVHGFAEELAKSRHVVSATARLLASSGIAVCAVDLYGCGDSAGSLADARFETWRDDVVSCVQRMTREFAVPCHLWGLRSGALTVLQAMRALGDGEREAVFWQPATRGRLVVNEFLRLRAAASMMSGSERESVSDLREKLAKERVVEVAGYPLGAPLVASMDDAELSDGVPAGSRIAWFDISSMPDRALSPAARSVCEGLQAHGATVTVKRIHGPAFWASGELQFCPALVEQTVRYLRESLAQ